MTSKNQEVVGLQKMFLLGVLILLLVTLSIFVSSFLSTLMIAAVIVTAVYPLHRWMNNRIRIPSSVSALLSLILVAVVIVGPFVLFFFFLANQATNAYAVISDRINTLVSNDLQLLPSLLKNGLLDQWIKQLGAYAPISTSDVVQTARDFVGVISAFLISNTTNILKNLSVLVLHVIVFLLAMFYFLKDGPRFIEYLNSLLPISETHRRELFAKLSRLSYGIIYGIFGAALAQGLLAGIGFAIVDINNPAFWGAITALLSPLPYVGTALVWIPVVVYLMITQHWVAALFLLVWSVLIVSTVDNFVKPYLIGSSTALHPLAVLLVILGGVFTFGVKGLIFGPFVLTLTLAFLHLYKLEFKSALDGKPEPRLAPPEKKRTEKA